MNPQKQLRILTYNVFVRPPGINTNRDDFKSQRLELFCQQLDNYDVICLQELFQLFSLNKSNLVQKALEKGFLWIVDTPNPSYLLSTKILDSGLLILSRYPVVDAKFHQFKQGALIDNISAKGVQFCTIQAFDQQFNIFNTHLQATYISRTDDKIKAISLQVRFSQILELEQFISDTIRQS